MVLGHGADIQARLSLIPGSDPIQPGLSAMIGAGSTITQCHDLGLGPVPPCTPDPACGAPHVWKFDGRRAVAPLPAARFS